MAESGRFETWNARAKSAPDIDGTELIGWTGKNPATDITVNRGQKQGADRFFKRSGDCVRFAGSADFSAPHHPAAWRL
jgi:hypothetical protein